MLEFKTCKSLSIEELRSLCAYQPFLLSDGTVTGCGQLHRPVKLLNGERKFKCRSLNPSECSNFQFKRFYNNNLKLSLMYEDIIQGAIAHIEGLENSTYLDLACNSGYFPFRFDQKGVKQSFGIDHDDYSKVFNEYNLNYNSHVSFIQSSYNSMTHSFDKDIPSVDIVSSIAFMLHISDPNYFLSYICALASKAVIIATYIPRSSKYFLNFHQKENRYYNKQYPICFDVQTEISEGLLRKGLQMNGFNKIHEIKRRSYWRFGKDFRCFVALRSKT